MMQDFGDFAASRRSISTSSVTQRRISPHALKVSVSFSFNALFYIDFRFDMYDCITGILP